MADTINRIESVKLTEQIFDLRKMRPGRTLCLELTEGEICTYYTEYKKRKRLGLSKTLVSKEEMNAFFEELYDFVRNAENSYLTIDDCCHKVTFFYGPMHREIFVGDTVRGDESLLGKIHGFVNSHR